MMRIARYQSDQAHPELWDGVIASFFPGLGPGGDELEDLSGYKGHGSVVGSSVQWVDDEGWAISFDGTNDHYVDVGQHQQHDDLGDKDFSLSLWFNTTMTGTGASRGSFFTDGGTDAGFPGYRVAIDGGAIWVALADPVTRQTGTVGSGLNDGFWHHLVVQFIRQSAMEVYIDGEYKGNVSSTASASVANSIDMVIGVTLHAGAYSQEYNGLLDDIRVYDRLLLDDTPAVNGRAGGSIELLSSRRGIAYEVRDRTAERAYGNLPVNLTLDADGTIDVVIQHDAGTGAPFYTHCNDAPDGVSSDYVENDSSESSGTAWFSLSDVAADFSSMDSLDINVDVQAVGFSNDTCTLTARIYDADNDTTNALTDESSNLATEADSTRTQRTVAFTGLTGTKAQWNAAHVRFTWTYVKTGGPDNANLRIYGCDLDGVYTQAVAAAAGGGRLLLLGVGG
jgi:hypothetical protein